MRPLCRLHLLPTGLDTLPPAGASAFRDRVGSSGAKIKETWPGFCLILTRGYKGMLFGWLYVTKKPPKSIRLGVVVCFFILSLTKRAFGG